MTTRTVIAALGLAILLGGIAWLIVGGGGGGGPAATLGTGDLLVQIDAFSARLVRVTHPDGRVEEARREGVNAPWLLTLNRAAPSRGGDAGEAKPEGWALQPTRITQFLRIVQSATTRAVPEKGSSLGKDIVLLELPAKSGEGFVKVRFGNRRLGGNVLAEVSDPARSGGEPYLAVVSDDIVRAITEPGMSGWRETGVMPDAAQLASRLIFERRDGSFTLSRVNNRWRLTAPFGAPADQSKIPGILRALESVRIAHFLDERQPSEQEAGLDNPTATVTLIADRPDGQVTRTLIIGAPVPGEPGQVFARIGNPPSPHIVRIDAAPLTTLPGSPFALVQPAATSVAVTDIFNIALKRLDGPEQDLVFRKHLERWGEVASSGELFALDDAGAAQIGELIQFLTTVQPERLTAEPPEPFIPLGTITLASMGAAPLDELTLGVAPTDKGVNIVLVTKTPGLATASADGDAAAGGGTSGGGGVGGVHRVYAEGKTPLLLRRFLSGEGGGAGFEPIRPPEKTSDPTAK